MWKICLKVNWTTKFMKNKDTRWPLHNLGQKPMVAAEMKNSHPLYTFFLLHSNFYFLYI